MNSKKDLNETFLASIVSAVSSIQNNNSYILKNNYANVFISKKNSNITLLKIDSDNQEFLNRSYINTNSSKVGFHAKEVLKLKIQIIMLKFLSLIMY